jgi:FkbM family methyltransferase
LRHAIATGSLSQTPRSPGTGPPMFDPTTILPADGFNELAICRHGLMLFNRHDQYVGASLRKYGEFSPGESALFRQIVAPGMTVLEIGANIGAHTVELSRLAGEAGSVHAFEPQRLMFQLLCANLALNSRRNVCAHRIAIGETRTFARIPAPDPTQPANFGGISLLQEGAGEDVPVMRVDDFVVQACHVMKIDVEGMEVPALRGARDTIRRLRPLLYVENDREESSAMLIALLLEFGYRLFWHLPPLFSPQNFRNDPENIFGDIVSINLLCVPAERHQDIAGFPPVTGPDDDWRRLPG